ncbi:MAG: hypothetical protein ABEK04_03330 [Candidatus Nanohalobium sp.]
MDSPVNQFGVSNGVPAITIVKLQTDRDKAITEDMLTDSSNFHFVYNRSSGAPRSMTHYHDGYWYSFMETNITKHSESTKKAEVVYNASGKTKDDSIYDSIEEANDTATFTIGNYTVDLLSSFDGDFIPGNEIKVTANVTRLTDGSFANHAKVQMYFTNGSWNSKPYDLNISTGEDSYYYNSSVQVPSGANKTYVARILAYNQSAKLNLNNSFGSYSAFIHTAPKLKGEIENFSASEGSATENMVKKCESGAIISTVFNVTSASAQNVTLSVNKVNRSNDALVEYFNTTLSEQSKSLYSGEFGIPDINTSKYKRKVVVKFNATADGRYFVAERTIDYDSLKLKSRGPYSTGQGKKYSVKFFASKPYSLSRYDKSRFDSIMVNVTDADNNLFTSINKSELKYNSTQDLFKEDLQIPSTAAVGTWEVDLKAEDIYSHSERLNWAFSVSGSEATFNVNDTTLDKDEMTPQTFNISVSNLKSSKLIVDANLSSNLESAVNISEDGEFNISAGSVENVTAKADLEEVKDISGQVNFTDTDSGYSQVIDLVVDSPDCQIVSGYLCSLEGDWFNVSADSRGEITRSIGLEYMAGEGNETNLTATLNGEIAEHAELSKTRYVFEDSATVEINYTVSEPGNITGTIKFNPEDGENLTIKTKLSANVSSENEKALTATKDRLDLGVFPIGSTRSATLTLANTGDVKIENISASSDTFTARLNVSEFTINAGGEKTADAVFEDISSSTGNITITGNTTKGEVTLKLPVNATPLPNYKEKIEQLRNRIDQIRPVPSGNLSQTITEVTGKFEQISAAWDDGEYLTARSHYRKASSLLDYVANNENMEAGGNNNDDGGNTGGDTGGSGNTDSSDSNTGGNTGDTGSTGGTTQTSSGGGGGLPLIPIIAVFVILLLVGFVVYTSYMPEEGDPLYGVLGE